MLAKNIRDDFHPRLRALQAADAERCRREEVACFSIRCALEISSLNGVAQRLAPKPASFSWPSWADNERGGRCSPHTALALKR
jgi:hypothetical protein